MKIGDNKQQSKSPDYSSNQNIIKSQKILNSMSNFHVKTQHEKIQQDHRSPQLNKQQKSQFRQTCRQKPRMLYNTKLPDVFNQNKSKKQYTNKSNKQDIIKNIDMMVENNQYKQTQKYLQPIKHKEDQKKKDTGQNRNPLIPFRKYMKIINKFAEDLNQDLSIQKFKLPPKLAHQNIQIYECVILEVIKPGHNTGTIKKMLHGPTLTLACSRQQPLNIKQARLLIKDWVFMWQSKLNNNEDSSFANVYSAYFNYKQGAVSILMEYFRNGSLLNLLNTTFTLPESVIRQIFVAVLKHLNLFYSLTNLHFGGLSPSQIMFTETGQIKLSLGLFYHIPNLKYNNIYYYRSQNKNNIFDFNSTHSKFIKNTIQRPNNIQIQKSIDIFKIGFIMLQCAIGTFQNYEQSLLIQESIKYVFTQQGQKQIERQSVCCLIHSQNYLIQLANNSNTNNQTDRTKRDKNQIQKYLSYLSLLKDRFSIHFINFLCCTLKLCHLKRPNINELQQHPFIISPHDNDNQTVKIDLEDLLKIGRGQNNDRDFGLDDDQEINKFIGRLLHVLNNCKKQVLIDLLANEKDKIDGLGKQTGMNSTILSKRLVQAINQMIKTAKN